MPFFTVKMGFNLDKWNRESNCKSGNGTGIWVNRKLGNVIYSPPPPPYSLYGPILLFCKDATDAFFISCEWQVIFLKSSTKLKTTLSFSVYCHGSLLSATDKMQPFDEDRGFLFL